MSLILEALRKLERDKNAPPRGFVVMTHIPWARRQPRSRLVGLGVLALALAVAALAAVLWRGHRAPAPGAAAATAGPTPPPSPTASGLPALAVTPSLAPPTPPPALPTALARDLAVIPTPTPRPDMAAPVLSTRASPSPPRDPSEPELRLNAISRRDDRPVAVLNDRLVREGDVFDGIRVVRIGETEVEVEVRGKRRLLRF